MKQYRSVILLATRATVAVAELFRKNDQLQALVYRGPASCAPGDPNGCSELAAKLLESSPSKINVTFGGPNEALGITSQTLKDFDFYVQPGGGDWAASWDDVKHYAPAIQDYVTNGGRYIGFCVGAYLAGPELGYNLLPKGDRIAREVEQDGAQVKGEEDTIIQVDWTYFSGNRKGKTYKKQWIYFQDGAVILPKKDSPAKVLGRYSSNDNVAASLSQYGDGWVGLTGPHPEATKDWYNDPDHAPIHNPQGVHFDIGYDFVEAIVGIGGGVEDCDN
ncbi:Hypothetical protein R9X50_00770100 [Acrodontium crateriforme]|uniref:Biotin-protein ligase N-terminal domain-containing protein n=1 Tax=Acrodontium crateriforme TaxID=150365 RepID=A0AAQ3MBR5_9PEZI|nr:Hypothetical protein R9X50_00770100 [Acrodontium crateriforme]